ncbi:hypothetical protein TPELB_10260 [Terrisporobacter petrolearius]|uniref:Uncharacterized protein n=1 Tax=Terrisporobacter petrolearius TaxID=1460447 RepID=A0ABZ3FDB8_9FIRM
MLSISYMFSYVIPIICLVIVLPMAGIVFLTIISSILLSVAIYYNVIRTLLKVKFKSKAH